MSDPRAHRGAVAVLLTLVVRGVRQSQYLPPEQPQVEGAA
jgi:hypothetical protein